jgi:N-acetylglucosaminylphosphatidylinositol deacetylase
MGWVVGWQIVTFDARGVSGHPNHIGAHRGVQCVSQPIPAPLTPSSALASLTDGRRLMARAPDAVSDTVFLELRTVGLLRKYWGLLDFPFSIGATFLYVGLAHHVVAAAMRAHASQWVWFRRLSVAFSRYSCINTLERMRPAPRA